MANLKHKLFLIIAKWIPVAIAAGILINNTLAVIGIVQATITNWFEDEDARCDKV